MYSDLPTWTIILCAILSFAFGFEFGRMYTLAMSFFSAKEKSQ